MTVTREDVAKRAGFSVATVSYVLNNSRGVSENTRKRVMDAVRELNYYPDMVARAMVTKVSNMIAIIANDLTNSMYGEIIVEIEKAAIKRGYSTLIFSGSLTLSEYLRILLSRRVDGVYISSIPSKVTHNDIDMFVKSGIPVVCGNYLLQGEERISRLDIDYKGGMLCAVKHFAAFGHGKITYLNGMCRDFEMDERLEGFTKAMREVCPREEIRVVYNEKGPASITEREGYEEAKELLLKYPETTAVMCTSDQLAFGAMEAFAEAGKRIPEDISIIGLEDNYTCKFTNPPLTSVSFSRGEFGKKLMGVLADSISGGRPRSDLVGTFLSERKSVAPPRK